MSISALHTERANERIEYLQANGLPVPGHSELGRRLQMSKSHVSELLRGK
jgi:hypothetical protein